MIQGKLKSLVKGAVMVKGKIKNTASVATFKDIKYELIFYSKTDAVIKTKNETLYEYERYKVFCKRDF